MADLKEIVRLLSGVVREAQGAISAMDFNQSKHEIIESAASFHAAAVEMISLAGKLKYGAYPELLPEGRENKDAIKRSWTEMHSRINEQLRLQSAEYPKYKYFFGQPYQAMETLAIFGGRNTEDRYREYGLENIVLPGHCLLDIGGSCGFMSVYTSLMRGCEADCVEHNPHMAEIGKAVVEYLGMEGRVNMINADVNEWKPSRMYDVIFSFATHYTDDEGHRPDMNDYIRRLHSYLKEGGTLVFEGHCYDYDNMEFYAKLEKSRDIFSWSGSKRFPRGKRELFVMRRDGNS